MIVMRKLWHKLHLWLSVPFGIVITLICFSGAMLVFEKETVRMLHPDMFCVSSGIQTLPLEELAARVAATLPDDVAVTGITVPSQSGQTWQVSLSKPKHAAVYIDPYTGEIKGKYERTPFFRTMFGLHRWLLGSRPQGDGIFWGKLIVGISTLLFVIVLVTGVLLWWPRNLKSLKPRLTVSVRHGWRRFWYDLHVAGGMYVLLLLLVMALTGLTWSFGWYRTGFYKLFGVEMQQGGRDSRSSDRSAKLRSDVPFAHWQEVYEELYRLNPSCKQITVSQGSATVAFSRLGNQRASDRYTFSLQTGEITGVTYYKDAAASGKIRGWIYSVHVGNFGGWLTRILWFVAALMGAILPLTGYYLWIKKRAARKSGSRKKT